MIDFLKKILAQKRKELEEKKKSLPFSALFRSIKDVTAFSLFSNSILHGKAIIAEIKKASPSKGILFSGNRIENLGKTYEENGASALSLVTEERYFQGSLRDLQKIKNDIKIPVLRKDFIVDEYQILESKQSGADAVLLITSILSLKKLAKFLELTNDLGMEAVVEVHTRDELEIALDADSKIIGINNRDLMTFNVDLNTSKRLLPLVPESRINIVESGIKDEKDLISYDKFKVNAFLIGEALITASNPEEKLRRFCSVLRTK